MARTPSDLYAKASIPTTKTEVIGTDASTIRILRKATFTNNSGSTRTVDLYIDSNGTREVHLVPAKALVDKEVWSCPDFEGHVLSQNGTVDVNADAAGVDLIISGIDVT
jgi:inner membrane protein involved in colicin E2 resistance